MNPNLIEQSRIDGQFSVPLTLFRMAYPYTCILLARPSGVSDALCKIQMMYCLNNIAHDDVPHHQDTHERNKKYNAVIHLC